MVDRLTKSPRGQGSRQLRGQYSGGKEQLRVGLQQSKCRSNAGWSHSLSV